MATSSSDLTSTLGKYMDRHLFLPLLDFLKTKGTYPPAEMERAKLEVLFKTNMVDLAMDIYKELHSSSTVPETMNARRAEVVGLMTELQEEVQPILELVQDQGKVLELRNEKLFNAAYLQQQFQITPGHIDALHRYAKFVYDTGNYDQAVSLLGHYRALTTNLDKGFSAMWGQLASAILTNNFDGALELLNALKEQIDNRPSTPQVAQLQQRSWLMHWALFLLGNHPSGKTIVADLFFQDKYLNALQTNCAHLLRYLAVAVVTNPRRRGLLKELVRTIGLERHQHSDAVTLFRREGPEEDRLASKWAGEPYPKPADNFRGFQEAGGLALLCTTCCKHRQLSPPDLVDGVSLLQMPDVLRMKAECAATVDIH